MRIFDQEMLRKRLSIVYIEMVRIVDYPLVLPGDVYGKHFVLPAYRDYSLRLEQRLRVTRPK